MNEPPLIVHIIHRLAIGGLENGLVNLINSMPSSQYRHAIICMTEYTDFRYRINKKDVECYALNKKEGHDLGLHIRLWKLLKKLRPSIVHTRNIGTIECAFTAKMAGVKACVHGEHGRDMTDIDGSNKKYLILRKMLRPFVDRFITVSKDLQDWLIEYAKFPQSKVIQIYNGVDAKRFCPATAQKEPLPWGWCNGNDVTVIGTVGQLRDEKDQMNLCRAFNILVKNNPEKRQFLRLILVGSGPMETEIMAFLENENLTDIVCLAGSRDDVHILYRGMDIFVLPSLGEGISNTILEAMASGLPVIATNVGGNAELVVDGETGFVVEPARPVHLADKLQKYLDDRNLMHTHGHSGRKRIEQKFSMDNMVNRYSSVYDSVLKIYM